MSRQYDRTELTARIHDLHAAGMGRNAIARELGVGGRVVSEIARAEGLTFARTSTSAATAARIADSRERRSQLAADILAAAESDLTALRALDPPKDEGAADRRARALASIARAVADTSRAIPLVEEDKLAVAEGVLDTLASGLTAYVERVRAREE